MISSLKKRKYFLSLKIFLLYVIGTSFFLFLNRSIAIAAPCISAEKIDEYLTNKSSPLAGYGEIFVKKGREYNIDPRLLVAITGAETSFGRHLCADFNAWNWFYIDPNDCSKNTFNSWEEGIDRVADGLRRLYLDRGLTTIPAIGKKYCGTASGCENWVPNVILFYTELGGDTEDLTFKECGLDLIFTIDVTGSMWDDIDAVKASATEIVNEISNKVPDWRIAVVDFQDFPVRPYGCEPGDYWNPAGDWPYRAILPFSTDKTAIINAINSLKPLCGWDWPESIYSALIRSINTEGLGEWRKGVKKVVILMTDSYPHDPEPFTGYTMANVKSASESVDPAAIYPVFIGWDSIAQAYAEQIAEQTGGKVFYAPTASDVVDAILEAVEAALKAPIAEANGPYKGIVGSPITFDASGSYDPDGEIVFYEWDWDNDGVYDDNETLPVIEHTWYKEFSGTIKLRVTDNDGLTSIDTASVEVTALAITGDLDNDGDVDQNDLNLLLTYRNQSASACPECDIDGDGIITVLDARKLVLMCTRPRCATE